MAAKTSCESCVAKGKYVPAEKLCTDCDERLCQECGDNHIAFKAFKSHQMVPLTSTLANTSVFSRYCSVHTDLVLDFFCTHHNTTCCRKCIPRTHQTCKDVEPLEVVSKDVKKSSLLSETLDEFTNIIQTLQTLFETREDGIERLQNSVSVIKLQIIEYKKQLVQLIDELEHKLLEKVTFSEEKIKNAFNETKLAVSEKLRITKNRMEELELLNNNDGSVQLFLALHNFDKEMSSFETEITDLISSCKVTDITFQQEPLHISTIGRIFEITRSCEVKYSPHKLRHAQEKSSAISTRPITAIKPDGELQLKQGEKYNITGMAVTRDNKLLLCNFSYSCPKVYIYTDCSRFEKELTLSSSPYGIALIPGTSKAAVTLPYTRSITIINIINLTKEDPINLYFEPRGVAASTDTIFVGGVNKIRLLDMNGKLQKEISITQMSGEVLCICLYKSNNTILCRSNTVLCCADFDGNILYQYKASGELGIALDEQDNVYVTQYFAHELDRISSEGAFVDKVLTINDGINNPGGLQFNLDFSKIFIVNNNFKTVRRFACS